MSVGRIYVVEDEALIAMELVDRLRSLGYEVLGVAAKGEQALREIEALRPDLALMDVRLADALSGVDVARALRERAVDVSVVFLTAYSDADLIRRACAAEPDGYLVKPFTERELHATLQMASARRAAECERRARRAIEARLVQIQKHDGFGRMAAATAHFFNNSFGVVLAHLEIARASVDPFAREEALSEAIIEVERAAGLSRSLQQYGGGAAVRPTDLDLGRLCRESTMLLDALLPDDARLTIRCPEEGPVVHADASLVRSALVLLATNVVRGSAQSAAYVTLDVGTLEGSEVRGSRTWPVDWEPEDRTYAFVSVDGCHGGGSFEVDNIDCFFDPFFSGRSVERGLDLAMIPSIARDLGGGVSVAISEGRMLLRLLLAAKKTPWG